MELLTCLRALVYTAPFWMAPFSLESSDSVIYSVIYSVLLCPHRMERVGLSTDRKRTDQRRKLRNDSAGVIQGRQLEGQGKGHPESDTR